MAVVAKRAKEPGTTRVKMNAIFFGMSVVMLGVMAISMWKDTHAEWRSFQDKYAVLERKLLLEKKADLQRQIAHPDGIADYKAAQKKYVAAKAVFDKVSGDLETTEADLEELDISAKAGQGEEGAPAAGTTTPTATPSSAPAKASATEMAELDKEFKNDSAAKPPPDGGQPEAAAPAAAAPAKASKSEMDELDKEFQKNPPPAQPVEEAPAAAPAKQESKSSKEELAQLDKEFQSPSAPKAVKDSGPEAVTASTNAATFEEATLTVDTKGADSRLEAAKRDYLEEQNRHTKELIALPKDEELKWKIAEAHLKEAKQMLDLASADVDLQLSKEEVKKAALVALWAQDVAQLKTAKDPAQIAKFQDEQKKLEQHRSDLNRDLRLVTARLERNQTGGAEIQQVYVAHLGMVDRCETCHKAVEDPMFTGGPEPFRTHPGKMLKWHPVEQFGCTSCHGGFGSSLEKGEAHGGLIGKGKPLMVGDQVQASCGKCHGESKELPGASTYLAGAKLFKNSGCLGCHKVETITNYQKAGPNLDRLNEKVYVPWLVAWLKNPRSHSLEARMPNFGLKEDEAQAMAAFLMSPHASPPVEPLSPTSPTTPQKIAAGKSLVSGLGCLGCHSIRGEGNTVGPELTNIRNKVRPEWLYSWIENPKLYLPNSRMPVFGLTKDQCVLIGNYLLSVGTPADLPFSKLILSSAAAERGAKLIGERGCAGCHDIKGFNKIAAPELTHIGDKTADVLEYGHVKPVKDTLYEWIDTKLKNPSSFDTDKFKAKMPKFGLDEHESNAIAVYLLSRNSDELPPEYTKDANAQDSPLIAGRRVFADHNCAGCHRIAGQGAKVGPDLTREGEKVQPSWLFGFLERPERIRWWQDARMPNFHLSTAEATTLTEFLMELSNQPAPYDYTPPEKMVFPLSEEGAKYFLDLKCQSCHPMGGKQAVAGGDTKKLGPDLAMGPRRLKGDWMFRFLKDPQAFDPGTQMPTFKQPDQVFHSLVDFLMKPRSP